MTWATQTGNKFSRLALVLGLSFLCVCIECHRPLQAQDDCVQIERRLPPVGLNIPDEKSKVWLAEIDKLEKTVKRLPPRYHADIGVMLKACRYAIGHREIYKESDFKKIDRLLGLAQDRIKEAKQSKPGWLGLKGRQVRGFRSAVDNSFQPIGLVFGEGLDGLGERKGRANASRNASKIPLYVWLHGRGDKKTDLHFLCERMDSNGQVVPPGAIVLHPFGRQCVGYKSAGETDVMEAIDFVCKQYPVDESRIVLMGFSMGGAGVWHIAAHYGERFVAASSGAGFAETAKYQRLKPENFPPKYEQILWRVYDVPGYTRNLFNLPFVAYSGEKDKQIQAARVMEEAFESEGRQLTHLIGPGMGHKYHPDTLKEILVKMDEAVVAGKPSQETSFHIQSPHLRYARRNWLTIDGVTNQYGDTRVDAILENEVWKLTTKNVRRLELAAGNFQPSATLNLDGQSIELGASKAIRLQRSNSMWQSVEQFSELRKRPGVSGPIDDAFIDPFLVVVPSGKSANPKVEAWIQCEMRFFRDRWRALMRGELRFKQDREVPFDRLGHTRKQLAAKALSTTCSRSIVESTARVGQPAG